MIRMGRRSAWLPAIFLAWRSDIRIRLYGGILLVVLASAALYTLYAIRVLEIDERARLNDRAERLVQVLGSSLGRPLFDINGLAVQSVVESMSAAPDVAGVKVYAPDGAVLAQTQEPDPPLPGQGLSVSSPVMFADGERIYDVGRIELTMLPGIAERSLRERVKQVVVANMLLAGAIVLLLAVVGRRMARPMSDIQVSLDKLAAGDMNITLSGSDRPDQVGKLSRAVLLFRDVLGQLQATESKLRELNAGLEQAVAERTSHLLKAMDQVRDSRAHLQAIVDTATDAVILTNERGQIQDWNARAEEVLGWPADAVQGKLLLDLLQPSGLQSQPVPGLDVLSSGSWWGDAKISLEAMVRHAKGHSLPVEWSMSRLNQSSDDDSSGTRQVCVFIRDISERRKAEDDIRTALARKEELFELRSRFISMASHEFRTPLTSILSSVELLQFYRSRLEPSEEAQLFGSIETGVQRMTRMLDRVLVIGRADATQLEFTPHPIDLPTACKTILLEAKAQWPSCPCVVRQVFPPDGTSAVMDEALLNHMLVNLLTNAFKYSPNGGEVLFSVGRQGDWWEFVVADQGIGISEADLPHVFSSFHRGSNALGIQGTGLGLAIVQRSAALHGGQLSVQSQLGQGSRFTLRLPVSQIQDIPAV